MLSKKPLWDMNKTSDSKEGTEAPKDLPLRKPGVLFKDSVRQHFATKPEVYQEIGNVLRKYKEKRLTGKQVINRVSLLLGDQTDLVDMFMRILTNTNESNISKKSRESTAAQATAASALLLLHKTEVQQKHHSEFQPPLVDQLMSVAATVDCSDPPSSLPAAKEEAAAAATTHIHTNSNGALTMKFIAVADDEVQATKRTRLLESPSPVSPPPPPLITAGKDSPVDTYTPVIISIVTEDDVDGSDEVDGKDGDNNGDCQTYVSCEELSHNIEYALLLAGDTVTLTQYRLLCDAFHSQREEFTMSVELLLARKCPELV